MCVFFVLWLLAIGFQLTITAGRVVYHSFSRHSRDHFATITDVTVPCFLLVSPAPVDRFPLSFFSTYVTPLKGANSTKRTGTSSKTFIHLHIFAFFHFRNLSLY